jgi:hypothetical protein
MGIQANERSRENGVSMGGVFGLGQSATFSAKPGLYQCGEKVFTASTDELPRTALQNKNLARPFLRTTDLHTLR